MPGPTIHPSIEHAPPLLKRQIQWQLFLRVLVLSLLLGISVLLHAKNHELIIPSLRIIAYYIAGVYAFTIISALILKYIRHYKQFAYFQLFIDVALTSLLVMYTGGSQSVFTLIYFFPIICGGLLLFRTGSLVVALLNTLGYGGILVAEHLGYHPAYSNGWQSPLSNVMILVHRSAVPGLTFFLAAFLSTFLSERLRKTEAALSETSQNLDRLSLLYKQIFDDITTGIITVDNHGKITSFNRASEEITGYNNFEIIGQMIDRLFPGLKHATTNTIRPVVDLVRKNGEKIPIGYSWTRLNMPDGSEDCRIYTFQDLSRIKKMEDQVRQAEKMASIGEMAAGIAHEFRNPLAAISGSAQMLHQEPDLHSHHGLMNIIVRECDRLETIINEFLQFSKPAAPEKKWFPLKTLAIETIALMKQTAGWNSACRLYLEIQPHLDCWADPPQIKQVLINLISNSVNALEGENGEITISAEEISGKDDAAKIVLQVTDNGTGVSEKINDKIFEPFFTTREKGTGLGLAIVWQIIESHGGHISFATLPTNETEFTVSLPLP